MSLQRGAGTGCMKHVKPTSGWARYFDAVIEMIFVQNVQ